LVICVIILIYLVLANAVTLSALGDHERVGKAFRAAVKNGAPMVRTYMAAGDGIRKVLPTVGNELAHAAATPLVATIQSYPPAAVAVVFGDARSRAQSRLQWQFRFAPFLLALSLFAWWRVPKNVHMVRQTRHR